MSELKIKQVVMYECCGNTFTSEEEAIKWRDKKELEMMLEENIPIDSQWCWDDILYELGELGYTITKKC